MYSVDDKARINDISHLFHKRKVKIKEILLNCYLVELIPDEQDKKKTAFIVLKEQLIKAI